MGLALHTIRRRASMIDRWDVLLFNKVAATPTPPALEQAMRRFGRSADRSLLWMAISGAMVASGRPELRRAAVRGLSSIAVTSLLANQVGKRSLKRARPSLTHFPALRLAYRVPVSNSFPSGHSASAAAFAVAVAAEAPAVAVPIGLLAAGVAASRVYTGVHYPSDVAVGIAIGAAVAGVGTRIAPAHSSEIVRVGDEPNRPQPERPTGRGLTAVINVESGGGAAADALEELRAALPEATFVEATADDDLAALFDDAARSAHVLGVAGGDGTINCAATAAMRHDVPLLVIPSGTFNHFAKDIGITSVAEAVDALATGCAMRIDVGEVDGRPFLNTASLGSYPEFVRLRSKWEPRWGKWLSAAAAMITVARKCPPVTADIDGKRRELLLFFVGNGQYEPRGFVPRGRPSLHTGRLDVRLLDERKRASYLRVAVGVLITGMRRLPGYVELSRPEVHVRISGNTGSLARDGEVSDATADLTFTVRRDALTVYRGAPQS